MLRTGSPTSANAQSSCLRENDFSDIDGHFGDGDELSKEKLAEHTTHLSICTSCAGKVEKLHSLSAGVVRMALDVESIHTSDPPHSEVTLPRRGYAIMETAMA